MRTRTIASWISALGAIALIALAAAVLPGCHTVQGVGEDISAMGQAGQEFLDGN